MMYLDACIQTHKAMCMCWRPGWSVPMYPNCSCEKCCELRFRNCSIIRTQTEAICLGAWSGPLLGGRSGVSPILDLAPDFVQEHLKIQQFLAHFWVQIWSRFGSNKWNRKFRPLLKLYIDPKNWPQKWSHFWPQKLEPFSDPKIKPKNYFLPQNSSKLYKNWAPKFDPTMRPQNWALEMEPKNRTQDKSFSGPQNWFCFRCHICATMRMPKFPLIFRSRSNSHLRKSEERQGHTNKWHFPRHNRHRMEWYASLRSERQASNQNPQCDTPFQLIIHRFS